MCDCLSVPYEAVETILSALAARSEPIDDTQLREWLGELALDCARLTDEQLDYCVSRTTAEQRGRLALYCRRLSAEQLDYCVRHTTADWRGRLALECDRLSDEQRAYCARKE